MRSANSLSSISAFLAQRRIAVIGVSRNPQDFTRMLFREFLTRRYDAVPVNPGIQNVDGHPCFGEVQAIDPAPTAALIVTSARATDRVVADCLACGIRHIWLYRAGGQGSVTDSAVDLCRERGVNLIAGECPFMFFPNSSFLHRAHGFIRRISGSYPKAVA